MSGREVKLELRSISEEERVKSGLTRAKLGGLSKAEIMEMVETALHNQKQKQAENGGEIIKTLDKKSRFWVNCKVYTAMILVIGLAVAVVIAKVMVLDPMLAAGQVVEVSTFKPLEQNTLSKDKYTGFGYDPDTPGSKSVLWKSPEEMREPKSETVFD